MKSLFLDKEICYTGQELSPHWMYRNFGLQGDSMVAFVGEADVKLDHMVDIQDVIEESPIYSKKMLHFIIEHFNAPLIEGVLRQRLLISIAKDVIMSELPVGENVVRDGDDLFYNGGKLSVSIATKSITSVLIHFGINIDSTDAPVNAAGLVTDLKLDNVRNIANNIIKGYCLEHEQMTNAACKVRGVI